LADPACLAKAEAKFTKTFPKREAKGGCITTGDVVSVEAIVDDVCVGRLVGKLPLPTVTPTPTTANPEATETVTPLATATPRPRPTSNGCAENPPMLWEENLATQNDARTNAVPAPVPPLAPLCWKETLAATAQAWADGCDFIVTNPNLGQLGENRFACADVGEDSSCTDNAPTKSAVVWANQDISYDYASDTCRQEDVCQGGANDGTPCVIFFTCPGGTCSNQCLDYTQVVERRRRRPAAA
jgi:hypothetical protein